MKIYTYHQEINFKNQAGMIKLWERSWARQGFSPVILSERDASQHHDYENFKKDIRLMHEKITKKPICEYGMACWMRWMAYSTQKEEKFYVSDYDVINHSFKPVDPIDKLHFMDGTCPCFASGTASQFSIFCQDVIRITRENIDFFIKKYKERNLKNLHDQSFLVIYKERFNKEAYELSRNRTNGLLSTPAEEDFLKKQIIHYGSYPCKIFCKRNDLKNTRKQRVEIAEKNYLNS